MDFVGRYFMGFRITLRVNNFLQRRIEVLSRTRGMSISEFIRYCVQQEVNKSKKEFFDNEDKR